MDIIAVEGVEADILAKAAAVECGSSHPLAAAIVEAAETRGVDLPKVFGGAMAIPGKAVTARLREGFVSVGSPRHAAEQVELPADISEPLQALEDEGKTAVLILGSKRILGIIDDRTNVL